MLAPSVWSQQYFHINLSSSYASALIAYTFGHLQNAIYTFSDFIATLCTTAPACWLEAESDCHIDCTCYMNCKAAYPIYSAHQHLHGDSVVHELCTACTET